MRHVTTAALAFGLAAGLGVAISANAGDRPPRDETTASQSPAASIAAARQAFPYLDDSSASLAPRLPTRSDDDSALAAARLTSGAGRPSLTVAVTHAGELCIAWKGTTTCRPDARDAAASGVFLAEVDCGTGSQISTIAGVVPAGVSSVTALGAGAGGEVVQASSDGVVTFAMTGASLEAIRLSSGTSNPLSLAGIPCPPSSG